MWTSHPSSNTQLDHAHSNAKPSSELKGKELLFKRDAEELAGIPQHITINQFETPDPMPVYDQNGYLTAPTRGQLIKMQRRELYEAQAAKHNVPMEYFKFPDIGYTMAKVGNLLDRLGIPEGSDEEQIFLRENIISPGEMSMELCFPRPPPFHTHEELAVVKDLELEAEEAAFRERNPKGHRDYE